MLVPPTCQGFGYQLRKIRGRKEQLLLTLYPGERHWWPLSRRGARREQEVEGSNGE